MKEYERFRVNIGKKKKKEKKKMRAIHPHSANDRFVNINASESST